MLNALIKRLTPTATLPVKGSAEAACWDLHVDSAVEDFAGWVVHTGLAVALPPGYGMLIFPRSGLGTKLGLTLRNSTGVIDSDYRGEVIIKLNAGYRRFSDEIKAALQPGARIAQATIIMLPEIELREVDELPATDRGTGGFGSTGV
jgi:dUTP pyrophosphatase